MSSALGHFAPPEDSSVHCTVDAGGNFNTFSPAWHSLTRAFELNALRPETLAGRSVDRCLSPPARDAWHDGLRRLRQSPGRPPDGLLPWPDVHPWPLLGASDAEGDGPGGLRLSLSGRALAACAWSLRRPWIAFGPDHKVKPVNKSARAMLLDQPEFAELDALRQGWMRLPTSYRLHRVDGLEIHGDAVWRGVPLSLHADDGFQLAAKVFRASLHDMSNPLAAVRMLTEAWNRGHTAADPKRYLPRVLDHLDTLASGMRDLRQWLQVDTQSTAFDAAAAFRHVGRRLRTELDRKEVSVDLSRLASPEPELEGPRRAFDLLATGLLLHSTGWTAAGDRVEISSRQDENLWRVSATVEAGSTPRPWRADPDLGFDLLERLVAPFSGRVRGPVEGSGHWRLDIPLHEDSGFPGSGP